jgi:hypothetical protein
MKIEEIVDRKVVRLFGEDYIYCFVNRMIVSNYGLTHSYQSLLNEPHNPPPLSYMMGQDEKY